MRGPWNSNEEQEHLPSYDTSRLGPGLAVDLVLLQGSADPGLVDCTSPLFPGSSGDALLLEGDPGREGTGEGVG